jgi:beta-fructofuranosidase
MTGVPPGHIGLQLGDGSQWHVANSLIQVPFNQWVLVTATRTANNTANIYYNGVLQASNSVAWTGTVSYTNSWFAIGQEKDENRPFTGLIDEVQVYDTALTAAQVQGIYNAGSSGVCP